MEVMTDIKEELNSVTSDSSFVILGNGPMSEAVECTENQSESFHKILTESSLQSLKSMELAMTALNCKYVDDKEDPNDIQQKLDQLVKDNLLLKETLNQSNMTMKSQFSTLSLWYEEVMKTYELHKQKFMEGQEEISKLQVENANLKKVIEENLEKCDCCNGNTVMLNISDNDIVALKKKLQSSEENCKTANKVSRELKMRNEELEKLFNDAMEEKVILEKKLKEALQESEKQEENAKLKNDKCRKCQSSLDPENGNEESRSKASCEPIVPVFSKCFSDDNMGDDVKEIMMLRRQLTALQQTLLQNSAGLEDLKTKNTALVQEKEALQDALKICKNIVNQFRGQVKTLNVQVKINDEILQSKTQELEQIKEEMKKLVLDCEEVAILRAQVELYENDFKEERLARERAVEAKEEMAKELRLLKRMVEKEEIT